jgi:regulator of protease activity HflC (stomatin/prohibitin superfamily)
MNLKKILLWAFLLLGVVVMVSPAMWAIPAGLGLMFLAAILFATFNNDEGARVRWVYIAVFFLTAALVSGGLLYFWQAAGRIPEGTQGILVARLLALVTALVVAALFTALFLVVTVVISSYYVLSLQISEDLQMWQVIRSFIALILDTNYDWMAVTDGAKGNTREKGVLHKLGGPGRIIVDPGNAIALQRGGKITRIVGAGVVYIKRAEHIRQIFDLRNHFDVQTLEEVMTADRIPLDVDLGIGYRIVRETDPHADGVISDSHDMFPVKEETILKAIYNNTAGTWKGLATGAPGVQVRDFFQSYKLEDLFVVEDAKPDRRTVSQIENQIKENLNSFAFNSGIEFTAIDIRSIKLPQKMMEAMMLEIKANAEARAIQLISDERNAAHRTMIQGILETIKAHTKKDIGDVELQLATEFAKLAKRGLTDDILGHQYIEMLQELAKSDGTKVFTPPNMPIEMPVEIGAPNTNGN